MFYAQCAIALMILLLHWPIQAQENYSDWTYSRRLMLNTGASGADIPENVYNFPLLVRVDTSWFNFNQAMSNGFDVRFSKADSTPLYFERERWDSADSIAEFWVLVDTIKGNDSTQFIRMYWGNANAPDSSNPEMVFRTQTGYDFAGVWHLGAQYLKDATANNNDGTGGGGVNEVGGILNQASRFDGANDFINVRSGESLDDLDQLTIETWIYPTDWGKDNYGRIFDKSVGNAFLRFYLANGGGNNGRNALRFQRSRIPENTLVTSANNTIKLDEWNHVAVVMNSDESTDIYVNGIETNYLSQENGRGSLRSDARGIGYIGNDSERDRTFEGAIDEMRISATNRSPHWIKLNYENQRHGQILISYLPDNVPTVLVPYQSPTFETKPILRWYVPPFPIAEYTIQIALDQNFTVPLVNTMVPDTFYTCQHDLPIDTIYWRVKAKDYTFSAVGFFIIHDGKIPRLIAHEDPTYIRRPTLLWHIPPVNPSTYTIQIADNPGFNPLLVDTSTFDTLYNCQSDLPLGNIFWRVQGDSSSFSIPDSFVVLEGKIPILIAYEDPTYVRKPILQWHAPQVIPGAYNIQIANNPGFNPLLVDSLSVDTFYTCKLDLPLGKIFWRVRGDSSSFSIPDSFMVLEGKTPILIPFEDTTLIRKPRLQWYAPVVAVSNYTIQISNRIAFDTLLVEATASDTLYDCQQNLPLGPIYWRVRGDSSAYSIISSFFVIEDNIPALIAHESPTYERRPTLTWHRLTQPVNKYTVQVSTSPLFDTLFLNTFVADSFVTILADLPIDTIFWRVKADDFSFSPASSFIILDSRVPKIIPFKPKVINYQTPILKWYKVDDSASYFIEIDNNEDFSSPIISLPVTDTIFNPPSPLPHGEIYWHVKSAYVNTWSETDFFMIVPDSIPMLVRYNGKAMASLQPGFFWHPVAQANLYHFTLADNRDFTNAIFTPLTDTSYTIPAPLNLGKWFWKVSCSRNLNLYSPVDSLIIDTTIAINPHVLEINKHLHFSVHPHAVRIFLNNYPLATKVKANVFSLNGRQVSSLKARGIRNKSIIWNYQNRHGKTVSSGIYLIVLQINDAVSFYKVMVNR